MKLPTNRALEKRHGVTFQSIGKQSGFLYRRLRLEPLEDRRLLTTYLVDSLADVVANDGVVTLREALASANTNTAVTADVAAGSNTETDSIAFDMEALQAEAGAGNSPIITLGGTQLEISDDVDIQGPGADQLTIDAAGLSRVFYVGNGSNSAIIDVSLCGLKITGGYLTGAGNSGGGICNDRENITLGSVTVQDNSACHGGGIYNYYGTVAVTNSTISGNSVTATSGGGGGIYNYYGSTLIIANSTISGNFASDEGGGIYNDYGMLTVNNSIVAENASMTGNHNDISGFYTNQSSLVGVDPMFVDAAGGDFRLSAGSIAIDAGDNTLLPADVQDLDGDGDTTEPIPLDLDGNPRVVGEKVDLGAYEFQSSSSGAETPSTVVTTLTDVVDWTDGDVSIREAIVYATLGGLAAPVTFDASLAGGTISLDGTEIWIDAGVQIDATAVGGITIDAAGQSRAFTVTGSGTAVELVSLNITGGSAAHGGGIYNDYNGMLIVINSTIRGNTASDGGGGIYNDSGTLAVTSSTIGGNTASDKGGGICNFGGTLTVTNSIVAGNLAASEDNDIGGLYTNQSSLVGVDPMFVDAAGGDFRLSAASPAIDAGDNSLLPRDTRDLDGDGDTGEPIPLDADGNSRVAGARVDLGAYEFQGSPAGAETPSAVVTTLTDVVDWTDGEISIREAIVYATLGGLAAPVTFDAALAGGTISLDGMEILIDTDVQIDATAAGGITIDAGGQSRVFLVNGGVSVDLVSLNITGGSVAYGGGIYIGRDGTLTVINSTIRGNAALEYGGGIFNSCGSMLTVVNSTIRGNSASDYGGGIFNDGGELTFTDSTIHGNTASSGGGIFNCLGTLAIANATISENSVTGIYSEGGGICNYGGTLTIANSILWDNTASGSGNNLCLYYYGATSIVTLGHDLVAMPDGTGGIVGTWTDSGGNLLGVDPMFVDADGGNFRLLPGSPAIDTGDNALLPADEQDLDSDGDRTESIPIDRLGNPRIYNTTVDRGAIEYQPMVLDAYLFYGESGFDDGEGDEAVAVDKQPLWPGQSGTSENYSNYSGGINGLMIDMIADDDPVYTAGDFEFRTGNNDNPSGWVVASAPSQILTDPGSGIGDTIRVSITWPYEVIKNTWLQITVKANENTGLLEDCVFYFGNFVGDVADTSSPGLVTAADLVAIRNHPYGPANPASIDNRYDINKDMQVDAADMILARNNIGSPLDALRMITPVVIPSPAPEGEPMMPMDWLYSREKSLKQTDYTLLIDLLLDGK